MAGIFDIIRSLKNKGISQTWQDSRNAPGGFLDKGRWGRAASDALVGGSNIYSPYTNEPVGNTVSNYVSGVPSGNLIAANSRLYRRPSSMDDQAMGSTGTNGVDQVGSSLGDASSTPSFLQLFEGNYFTDPAAYYQAVLDAIMADATQKKERGRSEVGRQKSSLLDQVTRLLEDLGREEQKGQANIASYYNSLGDIYQSSQGTREQEFAGDITRERGRIGRERDDSIAALDRQLNDYLEGVDKGAQSAVDETYGKALQSRSAFGPTEAFGYTQPGAVNLQDTSALRRNLESFLSPANVQRSRRQASGNNDIYSYLSPLG